ncbi:MAG TPA: c-type cytochrome [Longimicrobiales bacterium]|nr:c-type cytochrome [Longimicrobiales bacterium]
MKRWLKRIGIGVLALVVLIGIAAGTAFTVTNKHVNRKYDIKAEAIVAPTDSATVERGEHLATAIGKCVDCHGDGFKGQVMMDDPAFGRLAASNLTTGEGGVGTKYKTDADWERAIRHGVRPDGSALIFMPAGEYNSFTEEDVRAVIAYVKSVPAVNNTVPTPKLGPIARGLYLAKQLPLLPVEEIDHSAPHKQSFAPAPTKEYGAYMVRVGGCVGCHNANLGGGAGHGGPPAANLTPGGDLKNWTEANFTTALRTGKRPDGRVLDASMPWRYTAGMTNDEIKAVWEHLKTIPAVETKAAKK